MNLRGGRNARRAPLSGNLAPACRNGGRHSDYWLKADKNSRSLTPFPQKARDWVRDDKAGGRGEREGRQMREFMTKRERGTSMRANWMIATVSTMAVLAMNSVYSASLSGMWNWLEFHVPDLVGRALWQNVWSVPAAIHAGACLGTMLLMMIVVGLARG